LVATDWCQQAVALAQQIEAVNQITAIEQARSDIPRAARSSLAQAAQPYQDLIDRLLYALAGLTEAEAAGLEKRLARMM
jgi:hypothetical protein